MSQELLEQTKIKSEKGDWYLISTIKGWTIETVVFCYNNWQMGDIYEVHYADDVNAGHSNHAKMVDKYQKYDRNSFSKWQKI